MTPPAPQAPPLDRPPICNDACGPVALVISWLESHEQREREREESRAQSEAAQWDLIREIDKNQALLFKALEASEKDRERDTRASDRWKNVALDIGKWLIIGALTLLGYAMLDAYNTRNREPLPVSTQKAR